MATARTQIFPDPAPPNSRFSASRDSGRGDGLAPEAKMLAPGGALFIAADLLAIWAVDFLALFLYFHAYTFRSVPAFNSLFAVHAGFLVFHAGLIVLLCDTQRLYSRQLLSSRSEMVALARSVGLATILLISIFFGLGVNVISRAVIGYATVGALGALAGWRYARRRWILHVTAHGHTYSNVLIVGNGPLAESVRHYLQQHRALGFHVVDPLAGNATGHVVALKAPAGAGAASQSLAKICRAHFVDEILICSSDRALVEQTIAEALAARVTVRAIPEYYEGLGWGSQIDYLGKIPAMSLYRRDEPVLALLLKRALDIVVAVIGLILCAPLLLALAIWIKLDSPGPVFYTSRRVGKRSRVFGCHKLRTMVRDAEQRRETLHHLNERDGVLFKISADPRITRAGRLLRRYSLDEIPQLWNVLKGEMSIVGPRPPLANEVAQYECEYLRRLDVVPGITGLWQVEARSDPSFDRYISLDLQYVENWSILLDLRILVRTVVVVLAGSGR
jgi:exopolysaccharide biosynthesis polyprenyl glycosylphosphotransferase